MFKINHCFYGKKDKINYESVFDFLIKKSTFPPKTIFNGYFQHLFISGEYSIPSKPSVLEFLKTMSPKKPFALHLSSGIDSSILAKIYDHKDNLYITIGSFRDNEIPLAQQFASKLNGKFISLQPSLEEYFSTAQEILPKFKTPSPDAASVLAYIASKKAKELGYDLILTGDGAGFFGHGASNTFNEECPEVERLLKTLEGVELLNMNAYFPYMNPCFAEWFKSEVPYFNRSKDKMYIKNLFKNLEIPNEKIGWGGCWEFIRMQKQKFIENIKEPILSMFKSLNSDDFRLSFRAYSISKYLENFN